RAPGRRGRIRDGGRRGGARVARVGGRGLGRRGTGACRGGSRVGGGPDGPAVPTVGDGVGERVAATDPDGTGRDGSASVDRDVRIATRPRAGPHRAAATARARGRAGQHDVSRVAGVAGGGADRRGGARVGERDGAASGRGI